MIHIYQCLCSLYRLSGSMVYMCMYHILGYTDNTCIEGIIQED